MVGPLPLASVVGLEIAALAALLARSAQRPVAGVLLALVGVAGLVLALPVRGAPLGTAVVRRLAFLSRSRVAAAGPGDVVAPSASSLGAEVPGLPVGLSTLFPGAHLRPVRDQAGRVFALAEWATTVGAVVRVGPVAGPLVHARTSTRVPLAATFDRSVGLGIPLDSITLLSLSSAASSQSAGPASPTTGRQEVFLVVRLRPLDARSAIAARGGGQDGVRGALAALTSAVVAQVRSSGLAAEVLDVESLAALADASVGSTTAATAVAAGDLTTWAESWDDVTGPSASHRTFAAVEWNPAAEVADWSGPPGFARAVATEVSPAAGQPRVRVLTRVSDPTVRGADVAGQTLRRHAGHAGMTVRPVSGEQLSGLRATTPFGQGGGARRAAERRPSFGPGGAAPDLACRSRPAQPGRRRRAASRRRSRGNVAGARPRRPAPANDCRSRAGLAGP
ncbi:MAG TPA: type VII secretion protein EccE, partial [Candidatus Lustribacter sp.]|nr:type VII secretion protein EccE [Candidatus Lustribacter sp.]